MTPRKAGGSAGRIALGPLGGLLLLGSLLLGGLGLALGREDLAIGAGAGGVLSFLNFLELRSLAARLLGTGVPMGFRLRTLLRFGVLAVLLAVLASISIPCLLAALAVHAWSLMALALLGRDRGTGRLKSRNISARH